MVSPIEVRRMVAAIEGAVDTSDEQRLGFTAPGSDKGFAWTFNQRVHPKQPRSRDRLRESMIASVSIHANFKGRLVPEWLLTGLSAAVQVGNNLGRIASDTPHPGTTYLCNAAKVPSGLKAVTRLLIELHVQL